MKRIFFTSLTLLFITSSAFAQISKVHNKKANATERAQITLDKYQEELDLSLEQSTAIFTLLEDKNLKADSVRVNYLGYIKAIKTEVDQIPKEVSLRSRRNQIRQIKKKYAPSLQPMRDSLSLFNEQCLSDIKPLLSSEQLEKLNTIDNKQQQPVSRPTSSAPEPRQ